MNFLCSRKFYLERFGIGLHLQWHHGVRVAENNRRTTMQSHCQQRKTSETKDDKTVRVPCLPHYKATQLTSRGKLLIELSTGLQNFGIPVRRRLSGY